MKADIYQSNMKKIGIGIASFIFFVLLFTAPGLALMLGFVAAVIGIGCAYVEVSMMHYHLKNLEAAQARGDNFVIEYYVARLAEKAESPPNLYKLFTWLASGHLEIKKDA